MVEIIAFVLEYSSLTQYCEAVRKTFGYKELTMVVFCQFYSHMFTICRRTFSNVYSNIKNSTFNASYEFALCVRRTLEVKTTHYAI